MLCHAATTCNGMVNSTGYVTVTLVGECQVPLDALFTMLWYHSHHTRKGNRNNKIAEFSWLSNIRSIPSNKLDIYRNKIAG